METSKISYEIYEIVRDANFKLLDVQDDERKKEEITRLALEKIAKLLENVPKEVVPTVIWNVSLFLAQDFGTLLYAIYEEVFPCAECDKKDVSKKELLKAFSNWLHKIPLKKH